MSAPYPRRRTHNLVTYSYYTIAIHLARRVLEQALELVSGQELVRGLEWVQRSVRGPEQGSDLE